MRVHCKRPKKNNDDDSFSQDRESTCKLFFMRNNLDPMVQKMFWHVLNDNGDVSTPREFLKWVVKDMKRRDFFGFMTEKEVCDQQKWMVHNAPVGSFFTFIRLSLVGSHFFSICFLRENSMTETWSRHYSGGFSDFPLHDETLYPMDRMNALIYSERVKKMRSSIYTTILCMYVHCGMPMEIAQMIGKILWSWRAAYCP